MLTMDSEPQQELLAQASTAELVMAAQDGDREAFGQLVERFQDTVFAVAMRRVGNYAEAQELTQDVFVQAMRKLHQLREPACFIGWLRQITVRLAINRLVRGDDALSVEPATLEATFADERTPLVEALAHERQAEVRKALGRLRALDRQTLTAFYLRGKTLVQMSAEFESPIGTIKRRLHVARKRLAEALQQGAPELLEV